MGLSKGATVVEKCNTPFPSFPRPQRGGNVEDARAVSETDGKRNRGYLGANFVSLFNSAYARSDSSTARSHSSTSSNFGDDSKKHRKDSKPWQMRVILAVAAALSAVLVVQVWRELGRLFEEAPEAQPSHAPGFSEDSLFPFVAPRVQDPARSKTDWRQESAEAKEDAPNKSKGRRTRARRRKEASALEWVETEEAHPATDQGNTGSAAFAEATQTAGDNEDKDSRRRRDDAREIAGARRRRPGKQVADDGSEKKVSKRKGAGGSGTDDSDETERGKGRRGRSSSKGQDGVEKEGGKGRRGGVGRTEDRDDSDETERGKGRRGRSSSKGQDGVEKEGGKGRRGGVGRTEDRDERRRSSGNKGREEEEKEGVKGRQSSSKSSSSNSRVPDSDETEGAKIRHGRNNNKKSNEKEEGKGRQERRKNSDGDAEDIGAESGDTSTGRRAKIKGSESGTQAVRHREVGESRRRGERKNSDGDAEDIGAESGDTSTGRRAKTKGSESGTQAVRHREVGESRRRGERKPAGSVLDWTRGNADEDADANPLEWARKMVEEGSSLEEAEEAGKRKARQGRRMYTVRQTDEVSRAEEAHEKGRNERRKRTPRGDEEAPEELDVGPHANSLEWARSMIQAVPEEDIEGKAGRARRTRRRRGEETSERRKTSKAAGGKETKDIDKDKSEGSKRKRGSDQGSYTGDLAGWISSLASPKVGGPGSRARHDHEGTKGSRNTGTRGSLGSPIDAKQWKDMLNARAKLEEWNALLSGGMQQASSGAGAPPAAAAGTGLATQGAGATSSQGTTGVTGVTIARAQTAGSKAGATRKAPRDSKSVIPWQGNPADTCMLVMVGADMRSISINATGPIPLTWHFSHSAACSAAGGGTGAGTTTCKLPLCGFTLGFYHLSGTIVFQDGSSTTLSSKIEVATPPLVPTS
ncbi:hypothetical protein CYMTET_4372 [Cymbomonas tetramitiformis]|uniref:Uncharacterized protein n=2 Tax=Cymbomonas tetramitiformis TaxID=36881 RepID=A0AAE0H1B1_9CHLO|nr:hypothetical protein CYMTET_4372 [Cymbomonas tetramitiformis]